MTKVEARKYYRQKRATLTMSERQRYDDMILIGLQTLELPFINYLLSYYPMDQNAEIDTFPISDFIHFRNPGLHICYPKITGPETMTAIRCGADTVFQSNHFQIMEPEEHEVVPAEMIDLVLIPLLAFDENGNRAGYGKGFYDRYLQHCRPDCIRIGLSYFEAVEAFEDAHDFDVPLNFCITPQKVYVF